MIRTAFRQGCALLLLAIATQSAALAQRPTADPAPAPQQTTAPALTDDDRVAAFPDVGGHVVHDNDVHSFVLFDRLEWQVAGDASGLTWDNNTWVGRDRDRLWLRSEGQSDHAEVADADVHVLYGRAFARWWDVVAGVRQDFRPGTSQTWAAVGIQGLAPYWFAVQATAYVGDGGRTAARLDVDYELRLSNRLIVQPRVEVNLYGKSDPARGIGAGVSAAEPGLRLRYQIRREFAPYVGIAWPRTFGETRPTSEAPGGELKGARFVSGLRWWF